MKIYIPQTAEVRNRVINEISGTEEFDYICNSNEYRLLRELSEEEFDLLDIHSEEHEIGNVLVYKTGELFILDGLGYFRVDFKPINWNLCRKFIMIDKIFICIGWFLASLVFTLWVKEKRR